jgi:predicted phosphodiesterase
VDFFLPYADYIIGFGQGNHETGIIKHQETDILQRFVDLLNAKANTKIQVGGYGGWIVVRQIPYKTSTMQKTWKIKYFHGSGGGGIVTKGAINLTRALEIYEGFDVFTMGHIHENASRNDVRDVLVNHSKKGYYVEQKQLHMMLTGTYKEEYGDGSKGWAVEKGIAPKSMGCVWLKFYFDNGKIGITAEQEIR